MAACACAVAAQLLQAVSPYSSAVSAPTVALGSLSGVLFVILGLTVRRQRPGNSVGPLLIAIGLVTWIPTIEFIPTAIPWTLSNAIRGVSLAIAAHLYIAFPGTRPMRGWDRRLVIVAYVVWLVSSLAVLAFFDSANPAVCVDCPTNLFLLYPDERIREVLSVSAAAVGIALALAVAWRVYVHWMTGSEAVRRAMVPALVAVPIVVAEVIVYLFGRALGGTALLDLLNGPVYQLVALVVPFALAAGVMRTQLDRSAVGGLLVDIGISPSLGDMQAALRRTLHDRSIQLLAWSPGADTWVDDRGMAQAIPIATDSVAITLIERRGSPLAAVVHDPALSDEPALMSGAMAALRLALDNDRLTATVSAQAEMADSLPRGRVTFLYSDIEGSTELLAQLGDRYRDLLFDERGLIRRIVRAQHGREVDARADEFLAVFPNAMDAAAAALAIVRRMHSQSWPDGVEVRVRIGLHTGEPHLTPQGYVGLDVHRVARIGNAGHGGQIVLSDRTALAIRGSLPDGARLTELGRVQLHGLPQPDDLVQLGAADLPSIFPPLRVGADRMPGGPMSITER